MPFNSDAGIALIQALQGLGPWLEDPMQFFSLLGIAPFYLLVMPALLWCYDAGLGLRVGFILLVSTGLNGTFKLLLGLPRPYWISDQVRALSAEVSFGMPSGHAQNAVAVWGRLGAGIGRPWALFGAGLLILLISGSRIYLGVHFHQSVVVGCLIGALILGAFLGLEPRLAAVRHWRLGAQAALVAAGSLVLLGVGLLAWQHAAAQTMPASWQTLALANSGEGIDPLNLEDLFTVSGAFLGLGLGGVLLLDWGKFDAGGPIVQRGLRFALGAAVVLILYSGLGALDMEGARWGSLGWRYLRYALIGFWISYGAPRLFARVGLVQKAAAG